MRSRADNVLVAMLCITDDLARRRGDTFGGETGRMRIYIVALDVRGSGAQGLEDLGLGREHLQTLGGEDVVSLRRFVLFRLWSGVVGVG